MPLFLFPGLGVLLLGLLAFGILSANYYHSQAHTSGFWANLKWYFSSIGGLVPKVQQVFSQIISHWMGQAVQAVDSHIGASFHYLASEVKAASDTMLEFSAFALTVAGAITGNASWSEVSAALKQLRGEIKVAEHTAQVATERAIAQEKAAVRSVAQGVYPRLRAIEHTIEHPIQAEIKSARELAQDAEQAASRAWHVIRAHPWTIATAAFASAVAVALSSLGLGWLRCNSNPFNNNKGACGLWSILGKIFEGLAVLALSLLGVLRPEVLAIVAVRAVDVIEPQLNTLLADTGSGSAIQTEVDSLLSWFGLG